MHIDVNDADIASILLPKVLDLAAAEGLLASMRHYAAGEGPLCLDASAVEVLTLPCTQILLAAKRRHDRMAIENPSVAFMLALEDLGINWAWDLDLNRPRSPAAAIEECRSRPSKQRPCTTNPKSRLKTSFKLNPKASPKTTPKSNPIVSIPSQPVSVP